MNWDLETKLRCPTAEMASEWDSGKEAGEFVLVAGRLRELECREHCRNPILAFPEAKVLVHRVQDYTHIGRMLRILVLTRLRYKSLILGMIWERIVDYLHFWLSLWET